MIATPASRAAAGPLRTTSVPRMRSTPVSGRWTPARILTSVDLPAPFSPTSACTSPRWRAIDTSSSARIAPNAFEACSSERMGEGSFIWASETPACRKVPDTPARLLLEVELVDVLLVEHERRTEQHGPLRADLVFAELAGPERLAGLAADRGRRVVHRGIAGEVAEIGRVPQLERGDGAVLDVLAQGVRRPEPRQLDLAAVLRRVEHGGCRSDADRRWRDDALQVRILLQQALSHLRRRRWVVVAVHDFDELHLRVLLQLQLHVPDPRVLVRRRGGGRDDRDLARLLDLRRQEVDFAGADRLRVGLVDEQVAARWRIRVVGDDGDLARHRLLERRTKRGGVGRGDDERVRSLRNRCLDRGICEAAV